MSTGHRGQNVTAEPVDGVDPETLGERMARQEVWGDNVFARNGFAQVTGWGDEFDISTEHVRAVDGIKRACWLVYLDTTGFTQVSYFDHLDGELREIDTYNTPRAYGEVFDYLCREYDFDIDAPS